MSKLMSLIRRAPKRVTVLVATVAAAIVIPAMVFAYGPDRPTYTFEQPADHVTFNSITDNPTVGDERNFVRIKEDVPTTTYGKTVALQAGKTYSVEVYYHNNAATNLDYAAGSTNYNTGIGVAKNTMLRMAMPGVVNAGATADIYGYISASNATPGTVYDNSTATNSSAAAVALRYVPGSAKVISNGAVNGATLPDSLFTTGTPLGYDSLNGVVPGCNQFSGFVTFDFTVDQPNFTIQKQVSVDGGTTWNSSATTTPGSTVQYRVVFTNTGTTQQDGVIINDTLPTDVSYVAGSTYIANTNTGGKYQSTSDGITNPNGLNTGSYAPAGNAYFKFSAKVAPESDLPCGTTTLVNTARATTSGGYKESTASLTVNRTCTTTPVYTCDALQAALVAGSEYKFTGNATATNGATITGYVFDFGDGNSTTGTSATATHTYALTGKTYTARMTVNFMVNGVAKTATSNACTVNVTVGQPMCTVPGKTNLPANDAGCVPPTTPPELPHTGPTETILGTIGLGAIVASLGYFISSRRALLKNR